MRERYRDWYLANRDPIPTARLKWRAQLFRQLVHLLPGESVLEIGTGGGAFARQLREMSRGENEVVGLTFEEGSASSSSDASRAITLPDLEGRKFDFVVSFDVLDAVESAELLRIAFDVLKPGGEAVFFLTNPANPVLKIRRLAGRFTGNRDVRSLLATKRLEAAIEAAGFTGAFTVFTDFLYAPLSRRGTRLFHGMSAIMQNVPGVRTFSGAIVAHARKPGQEQRAPSPSIADHAILTGAVSVVVPCHNEEMNLVPLVSRLRELFDPYIHEIILVDDNSTDSTQAVIESLARDDARIRNVVRTPPGGVGYALRDGYRAATGRWILSLDADFQDLLPEVRDLFDAAARGADVVVGSRFSPDSVLLNYPVRKIIANRAFHLLASVLLGSPFRDATNNLKLMKREVAEQLDFSEPGFAVNAETGLRPMALGYKTVEVPISWVGRSEEMGTSSFKLAAAGPGYLRVLRRLRAAQRALPAPGALARAAHR
jgi:SAM-dependent methyltransferase